MRVWRLSDVCLSVAYIGPKSWTEKPRKTKIGTEVAHVMRDSGTTFKVRRSKINLQLGASRTAWCKYALHVCIHIILFHYHQPFESINGPTYCGRLVSLDKGWSIGLCWQYFTHYIFQQYVMVPASSVCAQMIHWGLISNDVCVSFSLATTHRSPFHPGHDASAARWRLFPPGLLNNCCGGCGNLFASASRPPYRRPPVHHLTAVSGGGRSAEADAPVGGTRYLASTCARRSRSSCRHTVSTWAYSRSAPSLSHSVPVLSATVKTDTNYSACLVKLSWLSSTSSSSSSSSRFGLQRHQLTPQSFCPQQTSALTMNFRLPWSATQYQPQIISFDFTNNTVLTGKF